MRLKKVLLGTALATAVALTVPALTGLELMNVKLETVYAETSGDWEYSIIDSDAKTVNITGYSGSDTDITIPSVITVNNTEYSVTGIGDSAFKDCSGLTSITIPAGVTSIGSRAFWKCSNLTSIIIPSSVTSIGDSAFSGCSGLTGVTIPKGVTSIGYAAFAGCNNFTQIVVDADNNIYDSRDDCNAIIKKETNELIVGCKGTTIPDSVTSIGDSAFYGCSGLTNITIPNSVTSIGSFAFYGCSGLTSITIPAGVTSIGNKVFYGCSGLTGIIVNADNNIYDSRDNCNAIIKKETNELIVGCKATIIPNSVTSIGAAAFEDCSGLASITIPEGVNSIGNFAFYGCSGLTNITILEGVTSIGDSAFRDCTSLTSITIPEGVTSIGNYAFSGCSGLTSITIPEGVTSIGNYAFSGCSGLTSITIPEGVTSIGNYAFRDCTSLTSITIPEGVTSIKENTFSGCSGLTSITIPEKVTSIGNYAFSGCSGLTSITIPASVTSIGNYAFSDCGGLTSITISEGVTSIGDYAFSGCSGLTSITIPASVTSIENNAFEDCVNLVIDCPEDSYASTYAGNNGIPRLLSNDNITIALDLESYTYNGQAKTPEVTVTNVNTKLVKDTDYTVTYKNNVDAGTATAIITCKRLYSGTFTKEFVINTANITELSLDTEAYTYDGKAKTPEVTVKCGDTTLVEGTDYNVTYENNVNVGTATVTVTGCGNYAGTLTKNFTIEEMKSTATELAKVTSLKQMASYAKNYIKLSWKKTSEATGYEVYRATSKNGKYKLVKTTTKTSFKNTGLKAGKKYYYKVRAYKVVDGNKVYGEFSSANKMVTKTNAPSIKVKKITATKAKVTWKKVTGADGYEVYMKTGAKGKYKKVKTLSAKKVTFTKTKLESGKKYTFKVRSYRIINSKKVYSEWSKDKSVTIKK